MNCPKCGYKLTHLKNYDQVQEFYDFSLGENADVQYTHIDTVGSYNDGSYECPNCGVELALVEWEAKAILEDTITSEMGKRFAEIALGGQSSG